MMKILSKGITLPKDTGPHLFSNIEWWYFFTFLTGDRGGRYGVMASFFRVGETVLNKGHYVIFHLVDLVSKKQQNYSSIDTTTKLNMVGLYLPFYLLHHPGDQRMKKLYKSLLLGHIPAPHSLMKKADIKQSPTQLLYGENQLIFLGDKEEAFTVHLAEKDVAIDLQFTPEKPVALIGGDGKPDDLYYYSFTRNNVQGRVQTKNGMEHVKGQGWFDHQWGYDYGLLQGSGWNWFGMQLDDGRELLLNEMRSHKSQKTYSPMANCIEQDGSVRFTRELSIQPLNYWFSPETKASYPIEWNITIPDFSMELRVLAMSPNHEMPIIGPLQAIWEGPCTLSGYETLPSGKRKPLLGKGFAELVGYGNG